MARKTTARDVAEAAGVSPATVDRVLNGRGGVAPEKERRVLDWARRLGIDRALRISAARTLRVAVLLQAPSNPFHRTVRDVFLAANGSAAACNMQFRVFHIPPDDPARIAARIREVTPGHDALVISAAQDPEVAASLREFARKGPVVTLATDIPHSGRIAYVGPDNRQAGRVAGDLMGRFLRPGGGPVLMIAGPLSMTGQGERAAGFRAVLAERYPECRVVGVAESGEVQSRAGDLVLSALRRHDGLRGVYNATTGARAVVRALDAAGRRDVVVVTHELTESRRALLRAGRIDAVIDQNPEAEVPIAIRALACHFGRAEPLAGRPPPLIQIHTIENA